MLQSSLIRAKIRKGKIYPVFADINNVRDVELASTMIDRFKSAVKNGETKGSLASSVKELEYYYDYRLVRGFYSLLERQSVFKSKADYHGIDPILLRRKVFEESSKRGFALTEYERGRIMSDIAKAFNINSNMLEELLMSDMDDNLLIIELKPISVDKLIASYNLSLIQTLLFKCVTFECKVSSGVEWKYLLRDVKRLGLMYMLEYDDNNNNSSSSSSNKKVSNITCIVDGPLSIFKMTEKYGTSIARLIPTIVNARDWYIRAWIVRDSNRARSYEFTLSSKDNVMLDKSRDPSTNIYDYNGKSITIYDSSIEERFANTFINYDTGWRLVREPEPIVVSNKAFIPDFAFEKGNIRVYLEIVGFWTKEYIERKLQKIRELRVERSDIDIIVAIDKELECSKHSIVSSIASNNVNVIVYEGKHGIPITHIINYLKSIEEKMINAHATSNMLDEIASIINSSASIIDMHLIAERYNISLDTLLSTLNSIEYTTKYTRVGNRYLVSNWLLDNIKNAMVDMKSNKFTDACSLLAEYGIPEECYATLLYLLGYDVVWNSININNAVIVKRSNNN
jgi:predicted nuclease of restriction endonuclease-like RecB superfamily